jgi:hypothetical protein
MIANFTGEINESASHSTADGFIANAKKPVRLGPGIRVLGRKRHKGDIASVLSTSRLRPVPGSAEDVFVHVSTLARAGMRDLAEGRAQLRSPNCCDEMTRKPLE